MVYSFVLDFGFRSKCALPVATMEIPFLLVSWWHPWISSRFVKKYVSNNLEMFNVFKRKQEIRTECDFCKTEGPGFGWDRVNFLPSSWYSAVFWI